MSGGSISGGTGDVTGPASSTDGVPPLYDGTTGKLLKNSTPTGTGNPVLATSPALVTPALGTPASGALGSCTAYEGTAVASTGEAGGTKFLREDGDGTSSWQAAGGGVTKVFAPAGLGLNGNTATSTTSSNIPSNSFADNTTNQAFYSVMVPEGATTITGVFILYKNDNNSSDVVLTNLFSLIRPDGSTAITTDSESAAVYGTDTTDDRPDAFTVNAAAYNSIATVVEADIVSLRIERIGADSNDTYGITWHNYGVRFEFS